MRKAAVPPCPNNQLCFCSQLPSLTRSYLARLIYFVPFVGPDNPQISRCLPRSLHRVSITRLPARPNFLIDPTLKLSLTVLSCYFRYHSPPDPEDAPRGFEFPRPISKLPWAGDFPWSR